METEELESYDYFSYFTSYLYLLLFSLLPCPLFRLLCLLLLVICSCSGIGLGTVKCGQRNFYSTCTQSGQVEASSYAEAV